MSNIYDYEVVIIGAGAMGTAFAYPCTDNKHDVSIIGTHLENKTIEELNKNRFHPGLNLEVIESIKFFKHESIKEVFKTKPKLIVIGVSSKGIDWIAEEPVPIIATFFPEKSCSS